MVLSSLIEKFTITEKEDPNTKITALFNPNKLSLSYGATWSSQAKRLRNVQDIQFGSTQSATLKVELMFDTYAGSLDMIEDTIPSRYNPEETSVEKLYIQKLIRLTRIIGDLHRPPVCVVSWGKMGWSADAGQSQAKFECVLESLDVTYNMFLSDGVPVRATANCSFKQWRDKTEDQKAINASSPDIHKRHVVQRGDTLANLAARYYDNPAHWREIASHNRIMNPRQLKPGDVLLIPILKG